jgi:hypothetical protein
MRLPHGRFLAGYTMGSHMASAVSRNVYDDETDAANAADDMARMTCEADEEWNRQENERLQAEENEALLSHDD